MQTRENKKSSYKDLWSKKFGKENEGFHKFFERHGIEPMEHLDHLDEIEALFDSIGLPLQVEEPKPGELYQSRIPPFGLWHTSLKADVKKVYSRINSYGLRSDEFREDRIHDGKHILFAGCSITAGDSMFEEFTWARKTYEMIEENEKLSGYYNIGICGATMSEVIRQIFIYIDKFGNPDVLFINFPNLEREVERGLASREMLRIIDAQYLALTLYCETNGIRLYAFSWDPKTNLDYNLKFEGEGIDPRPLFRHFYRFSVQDRQREMHEFIEKYAPEYGEDLMLNALDYVHPGMAEHDFYANFAYNIYKEDNA